MPISCTSQDLSDAAKCFTCYPDDTARAVQTYLLALAAGITVTESTPNELAALAKDFLALSEEQHLMVQDYLLCQAVNA